jgi:hypothetical protein
MAYELKTKKNEISVEAFLNTIEDEKKRKDCFIVSDIMKEATGYEPKMWGTSIVGFGSYHYKYASGHEGDSCLVGFSPRKANITLYLSAYLVQNESLMKDLGKYKIGKGCLYINKMEDVNIEALKNLIRKSIEHSHKLHGQQNQA